MPKQFENIYYAQITYQHMFIAVKTCSFDIHLSFKREKSLY